MDPLSVVVEEIALEGLDGITLPSLWIRLESTKPKFPLELDHCTKGHIWRAVALNEDLRFYELPVERKDLVLTDRFQDVDPETGIQLSNSFSDKIEDIYPVKVLVENKDGLQGSCVFFKERKDVTKHIRSKDLLLLLTFDEALQRYGRKLVAVASQATRFRALIGPESDPELRLGDDTYCVLEKVGRARWQGELQADLHGGCFRVDARKFHYLRKALVRHQLVTLQSHVKRLPSGAQQHTILLLLRRFHINRRTLHEVLMEFVSTFLQRSPDQFSTVALIQDQLNVSDCTFKRFMKNMRLSKLVQYFWCPLEELDPGAGPCTNKNGSKVQIRCVRLLKPYAKKGVAEAEGDDEDDEEPDRSRTLPTAGRLMEKDQLSQAYHIVLAGGTKGVAQRDIREQMNLEKLDSRMVCRKLEGDGMIKGFMEDEGRQRTTKFISHRCVGVSDRLQMFTKEREKNNLLYSTAPAASSKPPPGLHGPGAERGSREDDRPAAKRKKGKARGTKKKEAGKKRRTEKADTGAAGSQPADGREAASCGESLPPQATSAADRAALDEEGPGPEPRPAAPNQGDHHENAKAAEVNICTVVSQPEAPHHLKRTHETYRLLKRNNLIVETINNLKIVEGLLPLQKIIDEQEKQEGFSSKCCKKTIKRLVNALSRRGLLKMYTTTVIQDGISKTVDMVVHPSVQPDDEIVNQVIEQFRFKMSNSYGLGRMQHGEEHRGPEKGPGEAGSSKDPKSKADRRKALQMEDDFKPVPVRGLSRSLGFQPKMHRLGVMHKFLWYIIYGHPLLHTPAAATAASSDRKAGQSGAQQDPPPAAASAGTEPDPTAVETSAGAEPEMPNMDMMSDDEGESTKPKDESFRCDARVYSDEESWKRFVPPVYVHKDYTWGWAKVGDMLLCLPLSVYVQVVQVSYKVDGLEEYLNDPVKQHLLVRMLPSQMKRQLLFRRRYILAFNENLQRLAYMGLLQFGPVQKCQEKDQVFVYLKRNTTIVDTTSAEPHYWLVSESPDKPFERRHYTLNTQDDVESFWFDLMCVCLNTPLGVIRSKRRYADDDTAPSFVHDRSVFVGLAYLLKGSVDVCDDGSIPGDGKGAAGLDSEFFCHLKRNWLWTNQLLTVTEKSTGSAAQESKLRLSSLLTRSALTIAFAGGTAKPKYVTNKRPLLPVPVELGIEPASRNQQVVGGKRQMRKKTKKEAPVKVPRKRKKVEPKKRSVAHDEADHKALKRMTRQRVFWSVQEDSLIMLCCVATHLLNSKLTRPFVSHCVARDLLHSEFEVSMDKTSLSVGRRCRYILKNPQTLLNYRICVAEVYQDEALMKLLEDNKPSDPDNPESCARGFSEYIRLLRQKFSTVMSSGDSVIPDSKLELFSRFKVSTIDCGKGVPLKDRLASVEDIHAIVLNNLIQSTLAMTNSQMKSSRSFQTFHMYSRYDQELLCHIFIQWRKRGLVNRRRVNQPSGPKKNRGLPILPMSYQLSQSYYRCFSWRIPHSLCTDAFCFMRALMSSAPGDGLPATVFYHETETRSASGEDELDKKVAAKRRETPGAGGEEDGPDLTDMLRFSLDSVGAACAVSLSLMSLGLLSVHISIPKQLVVVDTNMVDSDVAKSMAVLDEEDDEDEDGEECEGKKRLQVKGHQASHTKYLMMRGFCAPGIVTMRNLNTTDNVVVESCSLRLRLRHTPVHHVFTEQGLSPLDLTQCGPSLLPPVLTSSIRSSPSCSAEECAARLAGRPGLTAGDLEACALIRASLDQAGPSGLDADDLLQAHQDLRELRPGRSRNLQEYLKDLEEVGQVVGVGGLGPRWVLVQHATPWLLTVNNRRWSGTQLESGRLAHFTNKHNVPFMRRRRSRQRTREPDLEPDQEPDQGPDTGPDLEPDQEPDQGPDREPDLEAEQGQDREPGQEPDQEPDQPPAKRQRMEDGGGASGETVEDQVRDAGGERPPDPEEEPQDEAGSETGDDEETDPRHGEDEHENLSFVSRPWRMVDGKLNRQVCKGMLEAVLFHIMSRPGVPQQALVEHYKDLLQPQAVLDLVQALLDLGSITKKTVVRAGRPTLFGRSAPPPSGTLEEVGGVFYEPTISCCLRLCNVLPNERHWNSGVP